MTPDLIAAHGPYQVHFRPGPSQTLILSCASIGHDPTRAPSPEWMRATQPHPTLFLIDAARSWGTAPGLDRALTQAVTALPRFARTLALGTSMGAFLALMASHILPLESVIAIGPQHRPATEPRWAALTADLPPDLIAPPSRAAQTYILHATDDLPQALDFAEKDHILFPHQSHSTLARHLKPAMPGLILAALTDRRRFLRLTAQAGGLRRDKFSATIRRQDGRSAQDHPQRFSCTSPPTP